MAVLVDTSVLIPFLRGENSREVEYLTHLEEEGAEFSFPAICVQEVLQGARDKKEWRLLWEYLAVQRVTLPQNPLQTHLQAAKIYFDCRRAGITVRGTVDCFIAQLAIEHSLPLLHSDRDYRAIARIAPLKFPL